MTRSFLPRPTFSTNDEKHDSGFTLPPSTSSQQPSYSSEIARRNVEIPSSKSNYGLTQPSDNTLTVGRNIQLNGEISACDKLIIEGRIEADVNACRELEVTDSGTFKGAAEIENAIINGLFEGDITVRHRLTVRKNGRIEGSIKYREMEIEPGAIIKGTVGQIDNES